MTPIAKWGPYKVVPGQEPISKALAPYYPADGGAMGNWSNTTLRAGARIDRFGSEYGQYFSPAGTANGNASITS